MLSRLLKSPDGNLALACTGRSSKSTPPRGRLPEKTLPVLIAGLTNPLPLARQGAAEALGRLGPSAKEATAALQKAMNDEDKTVRDAAAKAVQDRRRFGGARINRGGDPVRRAFRSNDWHKRAPRMTRATRNRLLAQRWWSWRRPLPAWPSKTTGTPGSPDATTTINGKQLPAADPKFGGVIKDNAAQSKAWWPPRVVPPKGAPNVLLIMTDDVGFGAPSTFGGVIPTPALDRIAKAGLRYTQFHSTALCSPTRAALITGRNHHSAGFGVVSEQSTGFPGYNSIIPKDKATIGRILKDNGFATSWFGKDHNTPTFTASQVGPFDQWPIGMGFDYFYGFVGGDTSQWQPNLFRNTTPIYPYVGNPGWNLTTAEADDAIDWLNRINQIDPEQAVLLLLRARRHARAAPRDAGVDREDQRHAPVRRGLEQAPRHDLRQPEEARRDSAGREDDALAGQAAEELGPAHRRREEAVHPPGGRLCRLSGLHRPRDRPGDPGRRGHGQARQHAHHLHQRRQRLQRRRHADRHAQRGRQFNGVEVPVEDQLKYFYDAWGSDQTYNHMAVPWTWAFDTPFSWTKQIASHFGGTRQGMCVSWPGHIKDAGGIRNQFHHVIDVVPTILEVCGIRQPE